jgi:hypothetical protein
MFTKTAGRCEQVYGNPIADMDFDVGVKQVLRVETRRETYLENKSRASLCNYDLVLKGE